MDSQSNIQAGKAQIEHESEIEDLIAELCIAAPNDNVKFCLRSYQHGKNLYQIERDINRAKKEVLQEACEFLQIPHIEHKNKKELSHLILCRIQNLLPDDCGLCNERYRIMLGEKPLLECSICGQGVHEECWINLLTVTSAEVDVTTDRNSIAQKYVNPFKLPGIFYICSACEITTIPKEEVKQKRRTEKVSNLISAHVQNENQYLENKPDIDDDPKANDEVDAGNEAKADDEARTDEDVSIDDDHQESIDDEHQESRMHNTQSMQPKEDLSANSSAKTKFDTVCRYFRRGTCKHGLRGNDCRFTHPQVCKKYTQHGTRQPNGCNFGKKCKRFHPLMCMDSLRKSECFNEKCTFNHIKGTRRQPLLTRNNQQKEKLTNKQTPKTTTTNTTTEQINAEESHGGNFLEMIRLMKAELITTMNTQIASLATQIQGIQQMQTHQTLMPMHQVPYQNQSHVMIPRLHHPVPIQMNSQSPQTYASQIPLGAHQIQASTQIQKQN